MRGYTDGPTEDTLTCKQVGHPWTRYSWRMILNLTGTLLASAEANDGTIRLWHLLTKTEVARFQHPDALSFVVDGRFLFSAEADKKILRWKIPDEVLTAVGIDPLAEEKNEVDPSRGKQKVRFIIPHSMHVTLNENPNRFNINSEIPGQRRNKPGNYQRIDRSPTRTTHAAFFERAEAERPDPSSTRLHGVRTFFDRIRPSSNKKGKQKEHKPKRNAAVVDVPLGQATYDCCLQFYWAREI
ncbi:uncharacterized protein EDB91DRAFT_1164728 [Suillus paluster]|uniref:uncharacterized protein n=1 Tax=Suillus paluster TaxID=48578 RepID=UPI001B86924C|nr:uncharacterized protein EDB91DRAFT_1164728 [Suillus paluster]KAG1727177.1 hypothetical protein EDB91DRAFT_1164728 [Suillus paluster]